ncbi:MAG: hypothetical protein D3917_10550 [Candidatus Electrothrix sp. AX5]|nr:hypothetical protein [Candidatus Electrothrix sp. AX5]
MNKNLIVTIFVPQAGQEKEGKIGTGYPVAEDLILTSRHTIDGGNGEVRVRWHHYKDEDAPGTGWIVQSVNDIVWKGEGELDVVLLRCPRPEKVPEEEWGRIADKKPPSGERWESQGFPCATRCESVRSPDDVSGTTESMADKVSYFVLNVTSPPKDSDMWQGASGMPVFVRDKIFGVVDSVPKNFDGKKLHAVPCWKMFEDTTFVELIRGAQEDPLTKAIRYIEELFVDSLYEMALRKLFLLCKREGRCEVFFERATELFQQYDDLEDNRKNGICKSSLYDLKKKEIRISSRLLLVDIKKSFNKKSACLTYEKEALLMEKQHNMLCKRQLKVENDLSECDVPDKTEKLKDILECLHETIEYLGQTIESFFILINKFKAVREYE